MIKLIALYTRPSDTETFLEHYYNTHMPIVKTIPGLIDAHAVQVTDTLIPGSPDYFLIAEMQFPDRETFNAAMQSPENRAAGKDLQTFAKGLVSLHVAEG